MRTASLNESSFSASICVRAFTRGAGGSVLSPIRFSALRFFGIVALFCAILLGFLPLASAQGKDSAADMSKADSPPSNSPTGIADKYIAAAVAAMFVAGVLILLFQLKKAKRKRKIYERDVAIQREEMAAGLLILPDPKVRLQFWDWNHDGKTFT